jgi:hypothetical protein
MEKLFQEWSPLPVNVLNKFIKTRAKYALDNKGYKL